MFNQEMLFQQRLFYYENSQIRLLIDKGLGMISEPMQAMALVSLEYAEGQDLSVEK